MLEKPPIIFMIPQIIFCEVLIFRDDTQDREYRVCPYLGFASVAYETNTHQSNDRETGIYKHASIAMLSRDEKQKK